LGSSGLLDLIIVVLGDERDYNVESLHCETNHTPNCRQSKLPEVIAEIPVLH
jgi:hypothetical protein